MDERTKLARAYIKGITTKDEFVALLDKLFITDLERSVIEKIYMEGKSCELIASELGYSTPTIKAVHRRVLIKVSNYIYLHSNR